MTKRTWSKVLACLLSLAMLVSFTACNQGSGTEEKQQPPSVQNGQKAEDNAKSEPIVVKYPTFQIGVNSFAPVLKKLLEMFDEKYKDKIKIEIEEIPGDQAYVDKMKVLLSSNDLPDIVYTGGYNLLDMALEKGSVVDLTPYLDANPEWKSNYDQATLDFNSRNGKIYSIPMEKTLIGYFYNKELFAKAGIQPAKTWDEFFANCDKLLEKGITPLSMDTADSGWLTTLWLTSILATKSEAGLKFANQMNPTDYNFPEFISAAADIQKMFQKYTTKDAVGGKYENGANNFLSGKTAMIANGPWMISDFSDETKAPKGFTEKVGAAIFPGQGVFDAPSLGYFVAAKDKAHQDAAVEVVKFFTDETAANLALSMIGMVPASTKIKITDEVKNKHPLLAELLVGAQEAKCKYNIYQALWYPNTLDVISTNYPALALGEMTPQEFAAKLTEAAQKNK